MADKNLHLLTATFPYGKAEQFIEMEVIELSNYFKNIYLYPLYPSGELRPLPDNVSIDNSLANADRFVSSSDYLKNLFLLIRVLSAEYIHTDKKVAFLGSIRIYANSLLQAKKLSDVFLKKSSVVGNNYFYSFWMNDGAVLLSILKFEHKIPSFIFRVNGFDLFDDRTKNGYMPFRYFNFKHTKRIVALSKVGLSYLKAKNIFPEKLILNYYGMQDNGINPFDPSADFTIVSCSYMLPLKRIDKIIGALMCLKIPVKWIHFGDGPLMSEMKTLSQSLPDNINYEFKGSVSNKDILDFYKHQSVNLFMHMSDTEGLGMVLIESQSFGIPALAVAAGGVVNVVNENTGILVTLDTPVDQIGNAILDFKNGDKNTAAFRKKVKQHWAENFDASRNYKDLFEKIVE
jgi:glycosyltransferase involved in cell wall biosynthesis